MIAVFFQAVLKTMKACLALGWYAVRHPRHLAYAVLAMTITYWLFPRFVRYPVNPEQAWQQIERESQHYQLDPGFVYAIACAESSLNGFAATWKARGIMQLTRSSWKQVTPAGYWRAWFWRDNLHCGIAYLGYCKRFLEYNGHFSYPLLAACYHYGVGTVEKENFCIDRLPRPANPIYRQLFSGNKRPVMAPVF